MFFGEQCPSQDLSRKNFNFPKRYNTLYDVTWNITVTGFCVICLLGHHTDADIHSFLQLCRALFTSLCVILAEQNEDDLRKFMYLFTCVFTLTEAASPSFFFSSSRPFSCRLSSPVFFFAFSPFFFISHGHSRPDAQEVAADAPSSLLFSSFIDSCMGPHLHCTLCELPTTD